MKTIKNVIIEYMDLIIGFIFVHPVTFDLKFEPFPNDEILMEMMEKGELGEESLKEQIRNLDWNTTFDRDIKECSGSCPQNGDARGCGNLNIPVSEFQHAIRRETGVTIADIAEIVYRLKGNKYDWFHERLCNFDIIPEEETEEKIKFQVKFKYHE